MVFPVVGGTQSTGYDIENSLRCNGSDSYLNFTLGTPTSAKKATFSAWGKFNGVRAGSHDNSFWSMGDDSGQAMNIVRTNGTPQIYLDDSDGKYLNFNNLYLRDSAAWYHFVVQIDTTQSTATNRLKWFINGTQLDNSTASHEAQPDQNYDVPGLASGQVMRISSRGGSAHFIDGYIAEMIYLDGSIANPSEFGETNEDTGIWVPKKPTGLSFGNNGVWLEFKQTGTSANASGIGADTSGNGNHYTVNNLAAVDVCTDTPSNNFCTLQENYNDDGNNTVPADYSEGNTKMLTTVDGWKFGRGTFLLEAGKWYAEVKATETGSGETGNFGIVPSEGGVVLGNTDDNDVFEGCRITLSSSSTDLLKLDTGSGSTIFNNFASGNTAMLAIDLDNNKIWVGREGTWYNDNNASTTLDASNHDIALPSVNHGWVFGVGQSRNGSDNVTYEYNWGNPPNSISSGNADANGYGNFEFAVPSGFYAVCTKNLAEYG